MEFPKCPTCRCIMWEKVDRLGHLDFVHPPRPCVAPKPRFFHECDICHEVDVELAAPHVGGKKKVICSDDCRLRYKADRKLAINEYTKKYQAKQLRLKKLRKYYQDKHPLKDGEAAA